MSKRQPKSSYWQDAPLPREQLVLFDETLEHRIPEDHPVRILDEILSGLDWNEWEPEGILKVCKGRSKRIGACPDTGYWIRAGIDPLEGIRKLGDRLITIQPHDLSELSPKGHDVPWGTGKANIEKLLQAVRRQGIKPTLIGLEYSYDYKGNMPEMSKCVEFITRLKLDKPQ